MSFILFQLSQGFKYILNTWDNIEGCLSTGIIVEIRGRERMELDFYKDTMGVVGGNIRSVSVLFFSQKAW